MIYNILVSLKITNECCKARSPYNSLRSSNLTQCLHYSLIAHLLTPVYSTIHLHHVGPTEIKISKGLISAKTRCWRIVLDKRQRNWEMLLQRTIFNSLLFQFVDFICRFPFLSWHPLYHQPTYCRWLFGHILIRKKAHKMTENSKKIRNTPIIMAFEEAYCIYIASTKQYLNNLKPLRLWIPNQGKANLNGFRPEVIKVDWSRFLQAKESMESAMFSKVWWQEFRASTFL